VERQAHSIADDRQAMAALLGDRMAGTYERLSAGDLLEVETSLVKSYLLESTLPEDASSARARDETQRLLTAIPFGRRMQAQTHFTSDDSLLAMEASVMANGRPEHVVVYLDLTNPRFWRAHSMGSSGAVDSLIDRLVAAGTEIDRAWLPADLLEHVSALGSFRGLSLDYDRRAFPDVDPEVETPRVEFLKMQLWGNRANDVLRVLREEGAFPNETTLAKVKVKYAQDPEHEEWFSLDDVKFDGKVTARGTSFGSHSDLLSIVHDHYAESVRVVERDFAIGIDSAEREGGQFRMSGEPIGFAFDPPIADIASFCDHVFSGSAPFRIWGVPVQLREGYFRVEAVDLHVGSPLRFEVMPELIRMYLPRGSCGNSALRLYTNLQHYYNAKVRAADGRSRAVFQF
jgi:hypothetical protein